LAVSDHIPSIPIHDYEERRDVVVYCCVNINRKECGDDGHSDEYSEDSDEENDEDNDERSDEYSDAYSDDYSDGYRGRDKERRDTSRFQHHGTV
jgi:hypothetical protein